ncbi:hypothetical protein [Solimonas soli]|uniref:hypothetical protein n=1 Tax=Solimonas soli TaxID=413479 RepID=UPI0012F7AF0F|nr:hypothetical protein [Solimonas soli]
MKTFIAGACHPDSIFQAVDSSEFLEINFEAEVVKALCCIFRDYHCGVFKGSFRLDGDCRSADLALIHKTLSHWFVVEVELASHSLEGHVLPQVRCFRFGDAEPACVTSLCTAFPGLTRDEAERILLYVPRYVAVAVDRFVPEWKAAFKGLDVHLLTVQVFQGTDGKIAHHVDGRLEVAKESLGFGTYSAIDKSLVMPRNCGLPLGQIQIQDPFGTVALWTVRESGAAVWITKNIGDPALPHGDFVQVIRTIEGRITLRLSR